MYGKIFHSSYEILVITPARSGCGMFFLKEMLTCLISTLSSIASALCIMTDHIVNLGLSGVSHLVL